MTRGQKNIESKVPMIFVIPAKAGIYPAACCLLPAACCLRLASAVAMEIPEEWVTDQVYLMVSQ
jgi:hypothetical protein